MVRSATVPTKGVRHKYSGVMCTAVLRLPQSEGECWLSLCWRADSATVCRRASGNTQSSYRYRLNRPTCALRVHHFTSVYSNTNTHTNMNTRFHFHPHEGMRPYLVCVTVPAGRWPSVGTATSAANSSGHGCILFLNLYFSMCIQCTDYIE